MRGGGCTLTFPIAQNDECLVVLASRCIDSWWQLGGVQVQAEFRMHDLSDGFAIVGPFSQATKISGWSTSAVQLRSNDGKAYVQLNPSTHEVDVVTSGNISANAGGTANVQSTGAMTLTAPTITLNGNVQINGNIGQTGSSGPGTAVFTAPITAPELNLPNGAVNTHYHSDPQGGNTGAMTG
jgi:phage baseplate assembly protein gpV